jgi:hypothetical protein
VDADDTLDSTEGGKEGADVVFSEVVFDSAAKLAMTPEQ